MASSLTFLLIAAVALLASPALSQTCNSQTFPNNVRFENCEDLPTLRASLHWTYNTTATPNTLSIAFIAPPAQPQGWVAWGLNPTATGMIGSQALVAFRDTNGSMVVRTYNISSYVLTESRISYEVLQRRAEFSGGVTTIFATLVVPGGLERVNQVWQVGSAVNNGVPAAHAMRPENLNARSTLQLLGVVAGSPALSPAGSHAGSPNGSPKVSPPGSHASSPSGSPAGSPGSGSSGGSGSGNDSAGSRIEGTVLGLSGVLVLLGFLLLGL